METDKALEALHRELNKIKASIAALEGLAAASTGQKRSNRGRKSMGAAERVEVSERMRKYWVDRRQRMT